MREKSIRIENVLVISPSRDILYTFILLTTYWILNTHIMCTAAEALRVVIILSQKSRETDTNHMQDILRGNVRDVVIVRDQTHASEILLGLPTGWVMLLQDDSVLDVSRLVRVFEEFVANSEEVDVLLPYKTMDSCNLGSSLNRGRFYRIKEIHSLRGMILHSSMVKEALRAHSEGLWGIENSVRTFTMYHGDPLFLVRPSVTECARNPCSIVTVENSQNSQVAIPDTFHNFNLPASYSTQGCTVTQLTFYTVYPNIVHFDAMRATRRNEMGQLNECASQPSTVEQYMSYVTYETVYMVLMLTLLMFFIAYLLFSNIRNRRREVTDAKRRGRFPSTI